MIKELQTIKNELPYVYRNLNELSRLISRFIGSINVNSNIQSIMKSSFKKSLLKAGKRMIDIIENDVQQLKSLEKKVTNMSEDEQAYATTKILALLADAYGELLKFNSKWITKVIRKEAEEILKKDRKIGTPYLVIILLGIALFGVGVALSIPILAGGGVAMGVVGYVNSRSFKKEDGFEYMVDDEDIKDNLRRLKSVGEKFKKNINLAIQIIKGSNSQTKINQIKQYANTAKAINKESAIMFKTDPKKIREISNQVKKALAKKNK